MKTKETKKQSDVWDYIWCSLYIIFAVAAISLCIFAVYYDRKGLSENASKISEEGHVDVYDEDGKNVGYVNVESVTANFEEKRVLVDGVLFIYVPEGCMSTIWYEWPRLSVACLNGTTTNYTLRIMYPNVRILTDTIEVIKK